MPQAAPLQSVDRGPVVSVVVMAYNEVENVGVTLDELRAALRRLGVRYEIVVIDDGSTDGTGALVDALAASTDDVRVLHHGVNAGLGGVYRSGFRAAHGEYLTFFPADGQFPASIINKFLHAMTDADMVLGYLPDEDRPLLSKVLSWSERQLYALLFGRLPRFQGVLMFRRELLSAVELKSDGRGWAVLMELIIRIARGPYRVMSIPTEYRPRLSGHSKVNNLRTIRANLRQVIGLRGYL